MFLEVSVGIVMFRPPPGEKETADRSICPVKEALEAQTPLRGIFNFIACVPVRAYCPVRTGRIKQKKPEASPA